MEIGIKGISYSATERRYLVRVKKDSKRVYIGRYSSLEEAKEALASHEGSNMKSPSDTPILESLRATFTPKKTKPSKTKDKTPSITKVNKKPLKDLPKTVVANQSKVKHIKKGAAAESTKPTQASEAVIQIDYHRVGEVALHRILSYLIKEADKRGTSIFDVITQEVARRAK